MDSAFGEFGQPRSSPVRIFSRKRMATTLSDWTYEDDELIEEVGGSVTISDDQLATAQRNHEIAKRLVALEASYFDDYGRELDQRSKAAFECFMKYTDKVKLPLLGAEESGAIVATWSLGAEYLTIRFVGRYSLDFAVSYVAEEGLRRKWGRSTLVTVFGECPHARRLSTSD